MYKDIQQAVDAIVTARENQIQHRYDTRHDDLHTQGELAKAGAAYALASYGSIHAYDFWPFDDGWNPGQCNTVEERIKVLAKAGALIVAEIERLQRLAVRQESV